MCFFMDLKMPNLNSYPDFFAMCESTLKSLSHQQNVVMLQSTFLAIEGNSTGPVQLPYHNVSVKYGIGGRAAHSLACWV